LRRAVLAGDAPAKGQRVAAEPVNSLCGEPLRGTVLLGEVDLGRALGRVDLEGPGRVYRAHQCAGHLVILDNQGQVLHHDGVVSHPVPDPGYRRPLPLELVQILLGVSLFSWAGVEAATGISTATDSTNCVARSMAELLSIWARGSIDLRGTDLTSPHLG